MIEICENHSFCTQCALGVISTGRCGCNRKLSIQEIYEAYSYLFCFCDECDEDLLIQAAFKKICCSALVCNFCCRKPCKKCTFDTISHGVNS